MADLKDVLVPDIGDFTDVPVVEVHVAPGDEVAENDPLITLETDKASMDVPAPFGGVVAELALKVGDVASEGTLVVKLAASAEAAATAEAGAPSAIRTAVAAEASARPKPAEEQPPPPKTPERAAANGGDPVYASPSVRRLARELGVPLGQVSGSGRKGRIVPEDVEAYANGGGAAAPAAGAAAGGGGAGLDLLPWPAPDFAKYGEIERVELSKIRRISAANLSRNWVRIPHVTHNDEADVTDLEAFRKQLNSEQSDVKVTMVALLLKAVVASLKAFPDVNASLEGGGTDALIRKKYYHLGFAADTPNGLVVPVVKDVDQKGLLQVAAELTELSGKARAGKLMPAEMAGATFTISSLGGIGGTSFTPIVNAPEV
ncbi:MAG TPA: 2-oxo acid dehydrogenase subunit E2, partial [Baekduia sp.]|nr:2-oxo acid dehydrogenase subunit E2 [Baekduia sp.]